MAAGRLCGAVSNPRDLAVCILVFLGLLTWRFPGLLTLQTPPPGVVTPLQLSNSTTPPHPPAQRYCLAKQVYNATPWGMQELQHHVPCRDPRAIKCHRVGPYCALGFVMVGQAKCATSSVFYWLTKHPQYFNHRGGGAEIGVWGFSRDWNEPEITEAYLELFPTFYASEKLPSGEAYAPVLIGEKHPKYMFSSQIAKVFHKHNPFAKIIFNIREPYARAKSHYLYRHERDMSAGEANPYRRTPPIDALLLKEVGILQKCYEGAGTVIEPDGSVMPDPNWLYQCTVVHSEDMFGLDYGDWLLASGIYVDQLRLYSQFFKPEQMLLMEFGDLVKNEVLRLNELCDFLGIVRLPEEQTHLLRIPTPYKEKLKDKWAVSNSTVAVVKEFVAFHDRRLRDWLKITPRFWRSNSGTPSSSS